MAQRSHSLQKFTAQKPKPLLKEKQKRKLKKTIRS
jgi:hypothetical protein